METRLIIAYMLIALVLAIGVYGGFAIAKHRAQSRKRGYRKNLF